MAILRAYFDRSELTTPARVTAVSGYVAGLNQWERFDRDWCTALKAEGVSCFHMTDFECRRREFANWSTKRRLAFLKRLIGVLKFNIHAGFAGGILLDDYDRLPAAHRALFGHPYALCGMKAVTMLLRWMTTIAPKLGVRDGLRFDQVPVALVFEAGDEGSGELLTKLEEAKQGFLAGRLASIHFEDKKHAIGLQAADFVAYETTKQFVRRIGADTRPLRKSLKAADKEIPHFGEYLDWKWFQEQLERYRQREGVGPELV